MGQRTTTRHKEDNTHRYKTFEEKLKNISVSVNLSIRDGRSDVTDDDTTFFFQEMEKWIDLNRTESFGELLSEIGSDVKSLPQVLLQKDRLAELFLTHLSNKDNQPSFEPTFALLVALARDLGQEIYPYFPKFFTTIIGIVISSKDDEIIKNGFQCYAYLSKYLRREIVRDLQQNMKLFAPLLDPKLKKYVVIFACESFEIVVSKFARDQPKKFLEMVYKIFLKNTPQNAVGVGILLFAMMKGVGGSLKINGQGLKLEDCMHFLTCISSDDDRATWIHMLKVLLEKLLDHANPNDTKILFKEIERLQTQNLSDRMPEVALCFPLYRTILEHDNGGKIPDVNSCVTVLKTLTDYLLQYNCEELAEAVTSMIEMKGKSSNPELLSSLKSTVMKLLEKSDLDWVKRIDSVLQDTSHYFHSYLLPIVKAYERIQQSESSEVPDPLDNKTIKCISEAVIRQNGFYHMLKKEEHFFSGFSTPMWFYEDQQRLIRPLNMVNLSKDNFDCCKVLSYAEESLHRKFNMENLTRLFLSYSRMSTKDCKSCFETTRKIVEVLISHHETCEDVSKAAFSMLLFFTLEALVMHGPTDITSNVFKNLDILKYLKDVEGVIVGAATSKNPFSLWSLKCVDLIVHYSKLNEDTGLRQSVVDFLNENIEGLTSNLQSGFKIVRTLTLSIIKNILSMKESNDLKLAEMYDKFLEIEDMSLLNPKFSPLAKSVLIECKVLMESETASETVKKVCLKYTLGLLYSNFSLIWPVCIEVIKLAGKGLKFSTFWSIFGSHFQMHFPETSCGLPRSTILQRDEDNNGFENEFLIELQTLVFGFPKTVEANLGSEENIDVSQYRINLWKSMSTLPLGKPEFQEIKFIIDKTITRSFENQSTDRSSSVKINRTLIPMFEFLEKCDLASADLALWENSLQHLMSKTPDVQKAVWEFLHAKRKNKLKNYKVDIDELIKSDSMDCAHKFRIDAIDTTQNKQYQNESLEKRGLLMDVVIRILIGKEKNWKGEKKLQIVRFIGGCTESDAKKYLELTVGPALKDDRISPKVIEAKLEKIGSAIRAWRYKFPNLLEELVNIVCDLAMAIENLKKYSDEEELPEAVFEDQKKKAIKAARLCIVWFFTCLPKFNLEQQTVERIFDVFIWTGIEELKVHTGTNISWVMKLFFSWSSHERFHTLLAKCSDGDVKLSPMQGVFDILATPTAHFEVRKHLLTILLNLMIEPEIEENAEIDGNEQLEHSEKFDARPIRCTGIYQFKTSESMGLNIILFGKDVILNLFQNIQLFKRFVNQPGGDRCLALISKLAEFVDGGEATQKLCLIIMETFAMYKFNEENLFHCLVACKNLLWKVADTKPLMLKLSGAFIWVTGRRLRTALSDILSAQKDTFLYENIRDLNAWTDLAVDTPDFSKRQLAFQNLEKAIVEKPFDRVLYTLTACNCFNGILHETDIGMRNSAKNLLVVMSQALKEKDWKDADVKKELHEFMESIILQRLRGGIHHKEETRFTDYLQVYIAFITNGRDINGTLKELEKVLTPEIIEGLQDLQIHLRTRAMNKLGLKLADVGKDVSPLVLKNFVLPLANHNLLDEEKLGKNNNELIDSSIQVLRIIMSLMPHKQYFKHLTTIVDNPKKKTKLAKQYERILVAAMDAFHFDLSLATSNSDPQVTKVDEKMEIENAEETEIVEKDEVIDEEPIGSDDEEEEEDAAGSENAAEPSVNELTLLSKPIAIRCLNLLKTVIIPKLRKYLNFEEKATHKLSRADKSVDEDVILKIPCTIALVKLLKKIPKSEGDYSIRAIIPSLCAGLRNHMVSVRNTLRKTLLHVIKELGIFHFRSVISYLKSSLLRGYQKHVLNFTVGYLMKCLESELKKNPDQLPIKEVLPLCEEELYGVMQEEKDLAAIKAKTREASKNNAHPILKLCAKCIQSKDNLRTLVEPAIKHLTLKRSPKVWKTTRQWLNSVSEGLADNIVINRLELIDWLKEVMEKESLEDIKNSKGDEPPTKKSKYLVEAKDPLLIAMNNKRKGASDGKLTGQFILTEFAFNCLYNSLNKSTRLKDELESSGNVQILDSFVKRLGEGIQNSSKQVNIVSLRCLFLLFAFDLDSFKDDEVVDSLRRSGFVSMNNHCYRTSSDVQMTNATFKFLTGFFHRFPEYKIVVQDFELMLKCIQSYLTHGESSSAAITLLKGVLENKFKSPNLQELMEEVFKQSIQSYYQHVNEGCRQAYFTYLKNYCTTPKELSSQVQLILNQFDYTVENGRLTAVEIMNSLLGEMPQKCFQEIKELVFLKTLANLDKEAQPKVREKLCEVMTSLFRHETKKSLVRLFLKLLKMDKHITELDTFFLIAGGLIEKQNVFSGEDFSQLLSKIQEVLDPEKFQVLCDIPKNMTQQAQDYAIYQGLVCLKKGILRQVGGVNLWSPKSSVSDTMRDIFEHLRKIHLMYEHEWVPLVTLDIFTTIFTKFQLSSDEVKDRIAQSLEEGESLDNLVLTNTDDLKILLKNLWTIIKFSEREDVLMKGALILVQLTCIAARLSDKSIFTDTIVSIKTSVNHEVVNDPKNTTLRSIAFGCYRGIVKGSPVDAVKEVAESMTRVAVRELTDEGVPADLKNEAEKLTTSLRSILGNAEFNALYAQVNDYYHRKRNLNRAKKKETIVLNPGMVKKRTKKNVDHSIPFKKKKVARK